MIALCAKEPHRFTTAKTVVENSARAGSLFYATDTMRLLTFDQDLPKQAVRNAPAVTVHLLT